ncbi:ATP-binding protein [Variovorax beijingensis]|uniref:ATP-binding protein n=1 Tax=Variovorax beijingensis TaxID=2496117 RepID=A0A3P3EZK1_9BURK|nr:AAA family ATPase [Variovorax beijingensis]RRH91667.1 ATP-binding protein [Variovorax beijingensis]RSZ44930.1 ATP-binding protein [Variovorax beijingensis]
MLSALAIANYRSLRQLTVPLGRLTVVTGPNGSGKSSVYRAMRLLAEIANGGVIRSLVREGGLASTLWAGPERFSAAMLRGDTPVQGTVRSEPVNLRLGFSGVEMSDFGYAIDIGLPVPRETAFGGDPEIKREAIWSGPVLRPATQLVDRKGAALRLRGERSGSWQAVGRPIAHFASMMTEYADPHAAPEMLALREQMRSWRFYDHFRSDADAPARQPQLGTYTPVLANDGADLAAALQTIREIGDGEALDRAVDDAFPGARIQVRVNEDRFETLMHQHGLLRPLTAAELSDGTLRYLLWIAALLTPRPPALLVLNEPETSLHPDLLPALGRLIAQAARGSQVIVVSHAARLIAALEDSNDLQSVVLEKRFGETRIANLDMSGIPHWAWPAR